MTAMVAISFLGIVLVITFVFSIGEKLVDVTSYQAWLSDHFKETVIVPYLKSLFYFVVLLESISSLLLLYGLYQLVFLKEFYGMYLASISSFLCFIVLLIGQRIAKDYQSAANLMIYILMAIGSLYLCEIAL